MIRIIFAAHLVALVGCGGDYGSYSECELDSHCGGGQVCTRTHECVGGDFLINAQINWTLYGAPVSPQMEAGCAGVDDLSLTFIDYDSREGDVTYAPVPCNLGRITYDKMPGRLDAVRLIAWDRSGYSLDEAESLLQLGENTINLDLRP